MKKISKRLDIKSETIRRIGLVGMRAVKGAGSQGPYCIPDPNTVNHTDACLPSSPDICGGGSGGGGGGGGGSAVTCFAAGCETILSQ